MQVKDYTVFIVGLFFLVLSLLTGGIIFYLALILTVLSILADGFLLMYQRFNLSRSLVVRRAISRRDLFLGASTQIVTSLEYSGKKGRSMQIIQPVGISMSLIKPIPNYIDLSAGKPVSLNIELKPILAGELTIDPMNILISSAFFRDTIKIGCKEKIMVHIGVGSVDARSSLPAGNLALNSGSDGDSKNRGGSGTDIRSSSSSGSFQKFSVLIRSKHADIRGGTDFSFIRNYAPGDDINKIDWVRSSRAGILVVREYEEDIPMPIFFILDVDGTMGTGGISSELRSVVSLTASLINMLTTDSNMFGLTCFSRDDIVRYQSLGIGRDHLSKVRDILTELKPESDQAPSIISDLAMSETSTIRNVFRATAGFEVLGTVMDETLKGYATNVQPDGFTKAILKVSRSMNMPCQIVVMTNLSMGLASLMNGIRMAKYYGHSVSVVMTPHIWYADKELIDAETCYEKYQKVKDMLAHIRGSGSVKVIDMCSTDRPEDAIYRSNAYRQSAGLRRR